MHRPFFTLCSKIAFKKTRKAAVRKKTQSGFNEGDYRL
jgi:hypothetical protein